jgi:hypothetical protein
MPNLKISFGGQPLLDIASYARRGPGRRDRLTPGEIAHISRTVRRVPEVVVKVLSRDSNKFDSVGRHLNYIGRRGELELETDDGDRIKDKDLGHQLMEDWDLDLDEHRRESHLASAGGRAPPKLVHKLMLSMPPGTPPNGVLAAARNFLREEFGLKHRYAFVLHTDEAHPHVHAVVKAVSEQGIRLNIRKATLREWRREFARHLREQGIEANATERAVRGEIRVNKIDGIFRAERRGASTHARTRVELAAAELPKGTPRHEPGKSRLLQTRKEVERGWHAIGEILASEGRRELASDVRRFVGEMPVPRIEREQIVDQLVQRIRKPRASEHLRR